MDHALGINTLRRLRRQDRQANHSNNGPGRARRTSASDSIWKRPALRPSLPASILTTRGSRQVRVIITADQVDELLDATVALAVTGARNLVPTLDALPADKQLVLVDLVFNMGEHGLSKFVNTLQAVKDQQWKAAASALQDSAWFHEVGSLPTQRGGADVAVLAGTATAAGILAKRGK